MPNELHPLVRDWFAARFGSATGSQELAWPAIRSGEHVLISAPTGSGKTLAAFLICLDDLVRAGLDGGLPETTQVLYVSPLKALSNDIHKNLDVPLSGIAALAAERGLLLPAIRTAVRTGDTPTSERQKMLRHPPHILVTTPESLFILLTAERSRAALKNVRTVIVDEIHAMADDKRGAHLALSLARLDDLVEKAGGKAPQRVGLSATVRPIETVSRFLAPDEGAEVTVINHGHRRAMDLAVEVPNDELGPVASNEMWQEIYDRLTVLINEHKTTLVFVNTRRLAERVAHHLGERLGEDAVLAHHGSLSRRLRLTAEERLKEGKLKAVVATASLELGIDIGTVDLVCQIGSPRSIAVALQRIGRSGHQVEHTTKPKGRIFATTRDELIECAALVRSISAGDLDRLLIPDHAAGRAGAADRRDLRHRRLARRRAVRDGSPRVLLSRPEESRVRSDHRHAVGRHQHQARPQRRVSSSRPRARHRARPARRAAGGHHVRRRDSRQRAVPRPGRAGRNRGGHARRGFRGGVAGRRRVPAGHHVVADPPRGSPGASAWRTRAAPRPPSRSGAAKRPAARPSSPPRCRSCARRYWKKVRGAF